MYKGRSRPFRPVALLSHVPTAEASVVTLWPLSQPVIASSDGPGQTSVRSSSLGHPV